MDNEASAGRSIFSRQVIYALGLLTTLHLLGHLDRRILAAVFPLIQDEWLLSDAQLGLVATSYMLARSLATLPAGWLADRRGRVWVLRLTGISWGALGTLSGLTGNFWQLLLTRIGVGLADGANGPVDLAFLSDLVSQKWRGRILSLYSLGMYGGSALGFILGGSIGERWGWRWAFIAPGLLGCLCAAAITRLREPPQAEHTSTNTPADGDRASISLRELVRAMVSPGPLLGLAGGSLGIFTTTALASWMPTFIHRYHGHLVSQAGLITGLVFLPASVLGVLLSGTLSDRLLSRTPTARLLVAASGLWIGVPCGLLAIVTPTWSLYIGSIFLAALFLSAYITPLTAFVQEAVPSSWRATATALCLLITQTAGGATATLAVGALSDAVGLRAAMLLPLAAALLGGLALLLGARCILPEPAG